uniref:Aryl-aldehyde dehydrogenase n=1 Tax=Pycnoporus cinnabarinus TaxID=5643 RepID=A0A0U2ETT9_PYCCI|nr:aryl-aldehyde dehydrogenase [Trametes cinnabarina]
MPETYVHKFDTPTFKGEISVPLGLYIDGKWVDGSSGNKIDVINPSNGKLITKITEGSPKDVDLAVAAAQKAFDTTWGLHKNGFERARLLQKLGDLMEQNADKLAALEALDNGKTFNWARTTDIDHSIRCIQYYAGWADKILGQTIETSEAKLVYVRHEPIGVVAQIIPWNFPLQMMAWKIGPALATGCSVILKPSEFTPLTALFVAQLIHEAGFPAGSFNLINGYGHVVGQVLAEHNGIEKIAFTGSTLVGRKIMEASSKSNLKKVTLELGGKSPSIVFDDADLEQAVKWAAFGIYYNHGQCCCAGSRIFVHEKIYDQFMQRFTEHTKSLKVGDPFDPEVYQGPQVSQQQYDRILSYIKSGKEEGATIVTGGEPLGQEGYYIQPTIFTDVKPSMKIVREEIFGPVCVVIKFKDDDDIVAMANDTIYGLAASVFSQNVTRALSTAHKIRAGTVWVNTANMLYPQVPFGGYKQSGIGRELGEYALANYTAVKAVQVNLHLNLS